MDDGMALEGKVAIVTGAGRGLGRAIAVALAKEGARLVIMSRSMKELKATAAETRLGEGRIVKIRGDVTREGDIRRMVTAAASKFGRIDVLVNNAGTIGPIGPAGKVPVKEWARTVEVNLTGAFLCTRLVLPHMIREGGGKVINISGSGEGPLANFSAYASSKSALNRLTETLAEEFKPYKIDVNAVAPGGISTRMTREIFEAGKSAGLSEHGRAGKVLRSKGVPLELPASLVVFLASSGSDGLTGKVISAVHDDWKSFGGIAKELTGSDLYTMRRIYPEIMERLRLPKGTVRGRRSS